jgi:hypothetical protein
MRFSPGDILFTAGKAKNDVNRRLPEITARAVLSIPPFEDLSSARRCNRPNTRSNVSGSRLFKEDFRPYTRSKQNRGVAYYVPKRPAQKSTDERELIRAVVR